MMNINLYFMTVPRPNWNLFFFDFSIIWNTLEQLLKSFIRFETDWGSMSPLLEKIPKLCHFFAVLIHSNVAGKSTVTKNPHLWFPACALLRFSLEKVPEGHLGERDWWQAPVLYHRFQIPGRQGRVPKVLRQGTRWVSRSSSYTVN